MPGVVLGWQRYTEEHGPRHQYRRHRQECSCQDLGASRQSQM
jgi:hypothetical protein